MAGSVTDIDSRRRAEDAMKLSEERYALAMAGLTGGHWVWDTETDALFVSDSVHQLFGLPPDTQVATRTEYFRSVRVHPDDWEGLAEVNDDVRGRPRGPHRLRVPHPAAGQRRGALDPDARAQLPRSPGQDRCAWPVSASTSRRASKPKRRCA